MGAPPQTKALFLDRDGVINVDKNYVWRIEDFEFLPDIFELCRAAQTVGLLPIIVTNQAGIGRVQARHSAAQIHRHPGTDARDQPQDLE